MNVFDGLASQKALKSVFFEKTFTHLRGLVGSGVSFRMAAAFQNNDQFLLLVLDDAEQAAYFLNDFVYYDYLFFCEYQELLIFYLIVLL